MAITTNDNILTPGVEIVSQIPYEVRQLAKTHNYRESSRRNNRKNTRGRHTQYIKCVKDGVWPPVIYYKCIKHVK